MDLNPGLTLEQHVRFSVMMEILYTVLYNTEATSHMWLLSTLNVASATEELSFFILIHLNFYFNGYICLMVLVLDGTSLGIALTAVCKAGICNLLSIEILREDPYMGFLL